MGIENSCEIKITLSFSPNGYLSGAIIESAPTQFIVEEAVKVVIHINETDRSFNYKHTVVVCNFTNTAPSGENIGSDEYTNPFSFVGNLCLLKLRKRRSGEKHAAKYCGKKIIADWQIPEGKVKDWSIQIYIVDLKNHILVSAKRKGLTLPNFIVKPR